MKTRHIYAFAAVMAGALLTGCGNSQKNAGENNPSGTTVVDTVHTSRSSLDYEGTYAGTLPCADCPGIRTEIVLREDSTYTLTTVYEGKGNEKENTFTENGKYDWDEEGSIITLANDSSQRYQVGEEQLFALDREGNRITGELADLYILRKRP